MLNKCNINKFISLTQTPSKKEGKKKEKKKNKKERNSLWRFISCRLLH